MDWENGQLVASVDVKGNTFGTKLLLKQLTLTETVVSLHIEIWYMK